VVNRISGQAPGLTPAGQGIPVAGGGFIRNGRIRVILRSEPVLLAETTADANGNVSLTVTLPVDTTPGSHTITLEGEAPDGTPRLVVYTIEVSRPCTINGTSRSEVIIGTKGDDVICAGAGNDIVFALGGNDIVFGGAGNDIIHGGAGDDHLDGGAGFDIVIGGPGRDTLIGEIRRR
jgi:Ca2+-binding RTX toxin-like protein